jgi:gliding motility-associated lipoprotein GldH
MQVTDKTIAGLLKHNMRKLFWILFLLFSFSCDSDRLFEKNIDFEKSHWLHTEKPSFEFRIRDTGKRYNLYCTIRNTSTYPFARLFFNYALKDSVGAVLNNDLQYLFLFDAKSGMPLGTSGIGDVFDQRVPLLSNHEFKFTGRYTVEFEQYMRLDTLEGISAIGLRVEEMISKEK